MNHNPIILGIDPGYGRIGIAVIKIENSKPTILHSECFETNPKLPHTSRLAELGKQIEYIIDKFNPEILSLETLLFSRNQKTAMQVAEARGVISFVASKNGLRVLELNPNQIKVAVTGYGKSDKKQVIRMVEMLVKLKKQKRLDDEYDAIASAIACSAILSTKIPS